MLKAFADAADAWVCDGYWLDFRYIASKVDRCYDLWDASLSLTPLPPEKNLSFRIDTAGYCIGQMQRAEDDKGQLISLLDDAIAGKIGLLELPMIFRGDQPLDFYSEITHRDRWFSALHLLVSGGNRPQPSAMELAVVDNALRLAEPPFDGLMDVAAWLGLGAPGGSMSQPRMEIRVGPPVDLIFERCSVSNDTLHLTLHAHPGLDPSQVKISYRAVPGNALAARQHATKDLVWGEVRNGRREGVAKVKLDNADSVLVMLMLGASTVRRQWFLDPQKARNYRLLATQYFDRDLKMVRNAVFESTDSSKFEHGISSLMFLLGFSPAVQIETDAPDLIAMTPGGKLVVVECTTRVADFASKIGKLVDRRGALSKFLETSGHKYNVISVLVCRLPRDQIAAQADELRARNTILISGEDIAAAFDRLRFPNDPDAMLDAAIARLGGMGAG